MAKFREANLCPPLEKWLTANGYTVRAEVCDCDVVARKGDDIIIIELKLAVNLDLLLQLVRRQQKHAAVYAAVPAPKSRNRRWRELCRLLRRIEAGLLLVHLSSALPRVELAFHPMPNKRVRIKSETRALIKEMEGRSINLNIGGGRGTKLMTAYRESALTVAVCLEKLGPCAPRQLRAIGAPDSTATILTGNPYGWFDHPGVGLYALTPLGREALGEPVYAELLDIIRKRIESFKPVEKKKKAAKSAGAKRGRKASSS